MLLLPQGHVASHRRDWPFDRGADRVIRLSLLQLLAIAALLTSFRLPIFGNIFGGLKRNELLARVRSQITISNPQSWVEQGTEGESLCIRRNFPILGDEDAHVNVRHVHGTRGNSERWQQFDFRHGIHGVLQSPKLNKAILYRFISVGIAHQEHPMERSWPCAGPSSTISWSGRLEL